MLFTDAGCEHIPAVPAEGEIDIVGIYLERLTSTPGYDAEAVYSPRGDKIVFTSVRSGDLELYLMNPDGSGQTESPRADEKTCWASAPIRKGHGIAASIDRF